MGLRCGFWGHDESSYGYDTLQQSIPGETEVDGGSTDERSQISPRSLQIVIGKGDSFSNIRIL